MIKIELYNPKTKKTETFTESFVPARALRRVVEFGAKQEKGEMSDLEILDESVSLVASIFSDERVTYDSIYDGIASDQIGPVLNGVLMSVMGGQDQKKLAKAPRKSPTKKV